MERKLYRVARGLQRIRLCIGSLLTLVLVVQTACSSPAAGLFESKPTPSVTATSSPTATLTATPTLTPTATPTPTPVAIRNTEWVDAIIRSVCLDMDPTYPEMPTNFSLPIEDTVIEILEAMWIEVRSSGESCDATLRITVIGEPDWDVYVSGDGEKTTCNTGGKISGIMLLSASGFPEIEYKISNQYTPPMTMDCRQEPTTSLHMWDEVWPWPVIKGLVTLWGPRAAAAVIDTGNNWEVAARALSEMDEDISETLPQLIRVLETDRTYSEIISYAANALGNIGPKASEAVPVLIQALKEIIETTDEDDLPSHGTTILPSEIRGALVRITDITCFHAKDEVRCWESWWDMQLLVEDEDIQSLIDISQDAGESVVRWNAVLGLGRLEHKTESVIQRLISFTKDPDPDVRIAAIQVLGEIDPITEDVIQVLVDALVDDVEAVYFSHRVSWSAREAITTIGSPAIPALIEKASENLDKPDQFPTDHSWRAFETLLSITGLRDYYQSFNISKYRSDVGGYVVVPELRAKAVEAVIEASWDFYETYNE